MVIAQNRETVTYIQTRAFCECYRIDERAIGSTKPKINVFCFRRDTPVVWMYFEQGAWLIIRRPSGYLQAPNRDSIFSDDNLRQAQRIRMIRAEVQTTSNR
ncbi:hypothetical protein LCM4579_27240 [Ensifer sp. LCM 4579]|nr:hypothetical protein LCM4579_27240 [Ensifer sp. LCM 4579]